MRILAIDTSCDESCVAIVDTETNQLLADIVHSHIDEMTAFGGIVPEIASREHLKALPLAYDQALKAAKLSPEEIDWIAVTNRPGLIGALLVGVSFGKALAYALKKPFSVFNHVEAHLFSPLLVRYEQKQVPAFPWVALVVSGGHTELFHVESLLNYTWLGGTLDDAAGEAFDKIGKLLNLPYPAGPFLDNWVKKEATAEDRNHFAFPRARPDGDAFSFSGLKTAVSLQVQKAKDKPLQIAASAQEAIVDALCEKVLAVQMQYPSANIVVTGGVACNSRLREKLPQAHFPSPRHCSDNAAMIALLAHLHEEAGRLVAASLSETASPRAEFI